MSLENQIADAQRELHVIADAERNSGIPSPGALVAEIERLRDWRRRAAKLIEELYDEIGGKIPMADALIEEAQR